VKYAICLIVGLLIGFGYRLTYGDYPMISQSLDGINLTLYTMNLQTD
jgi:hypothetical protein